VPATNTKHADHKLCGGRRRDDRTGPKRYTAQITSVVDGDTVRVTYGNESFDTVRLLGIDAPETERRDRAAECGGKRATASMLKLAFTAPADTDADGLLDEEGGIGRTVTVRTDTTQKTRDRFGRLLAQVATVAGTDLAVSQVAAGWAKVANVDDAFPEIARFRAAQQRARSNSRGAWRTCGGDFHTAL
jgi:micrococcal nuclease